MADYIYMMESRLTPEQQRAVVTVQEIARTHEMNVYLVGGTVRDIISGAQIRDLDFVVQGNALKLQKDFEKIGAATEGADDQMRTLYLSFPGYIRAEVTSARAEKYDKPGKPEVSFATINEDLRRRDFTANAMALSLNPGSRGLLMDPFNGVADIELKLLRVLHNYAFLEEPSRLIRATRFQARFHWTLEERTQARYESAKEGEYIKHVSSRAIGHELEQIAHEDDPITVMKALEKEGWMEVLHPHWTSAKADVAGLHAIDKTRQLLAEQGIFADPAAAKMYFLTSKLQEKDTQSLQRMIPRKGFVDRWKALEDDAKAMAKQMMAKEYEQPSASWKLLRKVNPETLIFLDVTTKQAAAENKIKSFLTKWPGYRQKLPYLQMTEMRITPDLPVYNQLTEDMFYMLLDGKLRTPAEIAKYLEPHVPPLPEPVAPARRGRAKKAEKKPAEKAAAPALPAPPEAAATEPAKGKGAKAAPAKAASAKPATPAKEAAPAKAAAPAAPAKAAKAAPAPAPAAAKKAAPAKDETAKPAAKKPEAKKPEAKKAVAAKKKSGKK
jgi:tRNA nucleotidyltransferase/poly(A) polymerase